MNDFMMRLTGCIALLVGLVACDGFLEVQNPGGIQDDNLDDPVVFEALVFGMEEDFGVAISELAPEAGVMADEWTYVGNSNSIRNFSEGLIRDDQIGGHWNRLQRALWVSEDGIERIRSVSGQAALDESPLGVRAHLVAGFANRVLGELFCESVFDGGPAEPHTVALERAENHFSEAARIAQNQGLTDGWTAAIGARASVRAWLGDWSGAEDDASQVPTDFFHGAQFWAEGATPPGPGGRGVNRVWRENIHTQVYTVAESRWGDVTTDPRVAFDTVYRDDGSVAPATDGLTPLLLQMKYPEPGADIPLVTGTGMLLLRAEARLRANDVGGAEALMNANRAAYGLDPISVSDESEAWAALQDERAAELWLEGRRFWDLRRWQAEGRSDFLDGRDTCIPISDRERNTNPNLS